MARCRAKQHRVLSTRGIWGSVIRRVSPAAGEDTGVFITLAQCGVSMATAKTGSFYLTETVTIPAASAVNTVIQGTVDLSAYVSVPSGMAVAIDQVDWIIQVGTANTGAANGMMTGNGNLTYQLTDLNPGTLFVRADSQSLVASGSMNIDDVNNITSFETDIYPDSFGPSGLSDAFLVVNDTLYVTGGNAVSVISGSDVNITCRLRARIVKLSTKDWMAIAIQSTAEA